MGGPAGMQQIVIVTTPMANDAVSVPASVTEAWLLKELKSLWLTDQSKLLTLILLILLSNVSHCASFLTLYFYKVV